MPSAPAIPPLWKTIAPIGCGTSSIPYRKNIDNAKRKPVDEITHIKNLILNESSINPYKTHKIRVLVRVTKARFKLLFMRFDRNINNQKR